MLKAGYVRLARATARPLRACGMLDRLQGAPRNSLRFWLGSQFAIYDAAQLVRLDVPWWTLPAIARVERWIAERGDDVRAFEYGTGASTAWLARRCRQVVSVEHDGAFLQAMIPLLTQPHVELRLVEPQRGVAEPRARSGRRGFADCDFSAYVDAIGEEHYDLIVIDGRARVACLERARRHLAPRGLVVFDNSARARYRPALSAFGGRQLRCRGWAPALPYRSETALITLPEEDRG
jgi:hypothetical protein